MKTQIEIDKTLVEPYAIIRTATISAEVKQAVIKLEQSNNTITLYNDDELIPVDIKDIVYFYTQRNKILVSLVDGSTLECKQRLYELQEKYGNVFVLFNQGVLANPLKVKKFTLQYNGTMQAHFINGNTEFVSRRCVKSIQAYFVKKGEK